MYIYDVLETFSLGFTKHDNMREEGEFKLRFREKERINYEYYILVGSLYLIFDSSANLGYVSKDQIFFSLITIWNRITIPISFISLMKRTRIL